MLNEAVTSRDEIQEKLRAEETIRRKLHNQIQELKGNIRVFCRVRPALAHEFGDSDKLAEIKFPDSTAEGREIECIEDKGESSLGKEIIKNYPFQFDKVFSARSNQVANNRSFLRQLSTTSSLRKFRNSCNQLWTATMSVSLHTDKLVRAKRIPCHLPATA